MVDASAVYGQIFQLALLSLKSHFGWTAAAGVTIPDDYTVHQITSGITNGVIQDFMQTAYDNVIAQVATRVTPRTLVNLERGIQVARPFSIGALRQQLYVWGSHRRAEHMARTAQLSYDLARAHQAQANEWVSQEQQYEDQARLFYERQEARGRLDAIAAAQWAAEERRELQDIQAAIDLETEQAEQAEQESIERQLSDQEAERDNDYLRFDDYMQGITPGMTPAHPFWNPPDKHTKKSFTDYLTDQFDEIYYAKTGTHASGDDAHRWALGLMADARNGLIPDDVLEEWDEDRMAAWLDKEKDNEDSELYNRPEQKERRSFNVGCDFKGSQEYSEYDDESIYIPESYHCAERCYMKHFGAEFDLKGMAFYGNSLTAIKKWIRNYREWSECPSFVVTSTAKERHKSAFSKTDKKHKTTAKAVIYVHEVGRRSCLYHAILVKDGDVAKHYDHIVTQLEACLRVRKDVRDDQMPLDIYAQRDAAVTSAFVYDLETCCQEEKEMTVPAAALGLARKKGMALKFAYEQQPYMAAIRRVSLTKSFSDSFGPIVYFKGFDCVAQMFDWLGKQPETLLTLYAHNGGRFDHLYAKRLENLKFTQELNCHGIKRLVAKMTVKDVEKEIVFLDTWNTSQSSLKDSAKFFNTAPKLDGVDVARKSQAYYDENEVKIKDYLLKDVVALGELLYRLEEYMVKNFGESITRKPGLPSAMWSCMTRGVFYLRDTFVAKDPVAIKFIRECLYGGRVLHWKKRFDAAVGHIYDKDGVSVTMPTRGLIALDGNALYPSGMHFGLYPVGRFSLIPSCTVAALERLLMQGKLFIAEVTLDAGNCRYPIVPFRTEQGAVIYPAGVFTGVYTSVDIQQAVLHGYALVGAVRGIYWQRSARIFEHWTQRLHEIRQANQKAKNPSEKMWKIAANALYGKFSEVIKCFLSFSDEAYIDKDKRKHQLKSVVPLVNGQYQQEFKYAHPLVRKPMHIGCFILSYSKQIMNELMTAIGHEHIYYGDTDSLYLPVEIAERVQTQGLLKLNGNLGGFKNDYADSAGDVTKVIREAHFLDLKRYWLSMSDGEIKYKFNGLNFKGCAETFQNWGCMEADFLGKTPVFYKAIKDMYEWFSTHPNEASDILIVQDVWNRFKDTVVISRKDLKFQVNPSVRADWSGPSQLTYYPKQWVHSLAARIDPVDLKQYALIKPHCLTISGLSVVHSDHYAAAPIRLLESSLPIMSTEEITYDFQKAFPKGISWWNHTCFVRLRGSTEVLMLYRKGSSLKRKRGQDEPIPPTVGLTLYKLGRFGAIEEFGTTGLQVEYDDIQDYVICVKAHENPAERYAGPVHALSRIRTSLSHILK